MHGEIRWDTSPSAPDRRDPVWTPLTGNVNSAQNQLNPHLLPEKFVLEPQSSAWKYPTVSPSRFWPLVEIHQETRAHGCCAELAQQSNYLAPMVAGMVDYVDQLLPERI
jgi:hypothetical protein